MTRRVRRRARGAERLRRSALRIGALAMAALAAAALGLSLRPPSEPTVRATPEPTAPAVDARGFAAGDIIADARFYDADAMSGDEIQAFVERVNAGCRRGRGGTPCASEYRASSPSFPADRYCARPFEGARSDTLASVVSKAARACGVSPQVLLVMLEKEQGLLTASGSLLTAGRYRAAMGYACPDSADCDRRYAGLARQVYGAARQLRIYRAHPSRYRVRAGATVRIAFSPDKSCGAAWVRIRNSATAALYSYTPYQPNQSALDGLPDACSSYGNLNFYGYFRAWFGSTR